jgi:hypothetical protein
MKQFLNPGALFDRALARYRREAHECGEVEQQPSRMSSGVDDGHVVLRNVRGELARYRISTAGRLLRVEMSVGSTP